MTTHEDPLTEIAGHAGAAIRAALAAGSHAATILAQRRERQAHTDETDHRQRGTLAEQRVHALQRVRELATERERDPPVLDADAGGDRWLDVIAQSGGVDLAAEVAQSATFPALTAQLDRYDHEGVDVAATLGDAINERSFDGASDPAAVLHYRLEQRLAAPSPSGTGTGRSGHGPVVPGNGGGVPETARRSRPSLPRPHRPASPSRSAAANTTRDAGSER